MKSEILRNIPVLGPLSDEELDALSEVFVTKPIKKNTAILLSKDQSQQLMFLQQGRAKVSLVGSEGKEVILAYLEEGDFFGEIALLTGSDRSADVYAVTDVNLIVLSKEDFDAHTKKFSGLSIELLRKLAVRLRFASMKIADLALFDVSRRVARALKTMSKEQEVDGIKQFVIENRPTHKDLAALVGTSREMVTRALKELEEDGYIVMDGKRVVFEELPL